MFDENTLLEDLTAGTDPDRITEVHYEGEKIRTTLENLELLAKEIERKLKQPHPKAIMPHSSDDVDSYLAVFEARLQYLEHLTEHSEDRTIRERVKNIRTQILPDLIHKFEVWK